MCYYFSYWIITVSNYIIHRQLEQYNLFIENKPYFVGDIINPQVGLVDSTPPYILSIVDFSVTTDLSLEVVGEYVNFIPNNKDKFVVTQASVIEIRLIKYNKILTNTFLQVYNQKIPTKTNILTNIQNNLPKGMNSISGNMKIDLEASANVIYSLYSYYQNLANAICPFYLSTYSDKMLSYFLADLPLDISNIKDKALMLQWCFSNYYDLYNSKIPLLYKLSWFLYAWTKEENLYIAFNTATPPDPNKTFILEETSGDHNVLGVNIYLPSIETTDSFIVGRSKVINDSLLYTVLRLLILKLCDPNTLYAFSGIVIIEDFASYGYTLDLGYYYINNPSYVDSKYTIAMSWDSNMLSQVKVIAKYTFGEYSSISIKENTSNYSLAKTYLTALLYFDSGISNEISLTLCEVSPNADNYHSYIIGGYVIIPKNSPSFSETYTIKWLNQDGNKITTTYTIIN